MKFKFDPKQVFQLDAIASIVDIFEGQPLRSLNVRFQLGGIPAVANELDLTDAQLLKNVQAVQARNQVYVDDQLRNLEGTSPVPDSHETIHFHNFSVEMETGTGKTYVYIRTALELFRRYGFLKFIIVVPSVAIREGVMKTFEMTREHYRGLLDNVPYRAYEYDAANLTQVRQFALSDSVEFMVMTLASFNKTDINVIFRSTDRLQGETPVQLIQAARPILILDEPQNMESEKSIAALAALRPLFALRYSATHRHPYNLMYRLTPARAYRLGLVKQIEVASVAREDETNRPYIRLNWVKSDKRTLTANLTIHKLMATGEVKETRVTCRPGDSLQEKSGNRPIYQGFDIDEINTAWQFVRFANTVQLKVGEETGADRSEIFEAQIYATVLEHIQKQARFEDTGIKVLSLFFVDRVDNFRRPDSVIRKLFNKTFNQLKGRWEPWHDLQPDDVQAAYFASRTTRDGEVIYEDSSTGTSQKDVEAYELIMREKERLLSFDEATAFIFTHSALREGWDNPNVFQICTLNQSVSDMRKRQEIGRGVRLSVNQDGERLHDERVNILTVIANESYEHFVREYQREITEEFRAAIKGRYGRPFEQLTSAERAAAEKEFAILLPPVPKNARLRATAKVLSREHGSQHTLKDGRAYTLHPDFEPLWNAISQKTRYSVKVDTEKLVNDVVIALQTISIPRPRVTVTKARVDYDVAAGFQALQMSAAKSLLSLVGRYPLPNLLDIMSHLMDHTTPPMRLTRRTLLEIIREAPDQNALIENPNEFATQAVAIIKDKLADQLIKGITYHPIDDWYAMELFEPTIGTWQEHMVPVSRSIYDHVIVDSDVERAFVQGLEHREDIHFFIKLPNWFTVPTPIGNYNPDWAISMDDPRTGQQRLYLIQETKYLPDVTSLQGIEERRKVECGRAHFKDALKIHYSLGPDLSDLPGADHSLITPE